MTPDQRIQQLRRLLAQEGLQAYVIDREAMDALLGVRGIGPPFGYYEQGFDEGLDNVYTRLRALISSNAVTLEPKNINE